MSQRSPKRWVPAGILATGSLLLLVARDQVQIPLVTPLNTISLNLLGYTGRDLVVPPDQQRIAGMTNYLMRVFATSDSAPPLFSVYVGYYEAQLQGKSIHSPKNCLPGAGWEPLSAGYATLHTPNGDFRVNRYVLANGSNTALVYYWYQGRGRIQANEYAVKWDLLRDKALSGRSEEALVRIVVDMRDGKPAPADSLASRLGAQLVGEVQKHLPEFPGRSLSGE